MSCARAHSPALRPFRFAASRHRRASASSSIFRLLATENLRFAAEPGGHVRGNHPGVADGSLLYLAIDRHDPRPLIVDQPEENLDPKSVFEELVPHFREARHRRQIIIVTHNANLVVNTDADQVIVASSKRTANDALPEISYAAGGLENPSIRQAVCETLEGGERAFMERERRYRLHWLETLGDRAKEGDAGPDGALEQSSRGAT